MVIPVFRKLGVQSKVLAMVLAASLLSLLLTGAVSYAIGSSSLITATTNELVALRHSRAEALNNYLTSLYNHVLTYSDSAMVIDAVKNMRVAFAKLETAKLTPEQEKSLEEYYEDTFLPDLRRAIPGEPLLGTYLPETPQHKYLGYHYMVNNPNKSNHRLLHDAGDGSDYSKFHAKFNKRFTRISKVYGYRDVFLVDASTGDVLFTNAKEVDFASNLNEGPYADSALGKVFRELRKAKNPSFVYFSDFEHYIASKGEPAMFVGATIFDGDQFIGAIIYQLTPDRIDAVMTDNSSWKLQGLGRTGESYLVAPDYRFRSSPREFLERPQEYFRVLKQQGVSDARISDIKRTGSPILIQEVKTEGAQRALKGKSGHVEYVDYRGQNVIASYQPIRLGQFEWGLVVKMDKSEALSGVATMRNLILLVAAILVPLFTLLSLILSRSFVKPIHRLIRATGRVRSGDQDVQVPVEADDEFGELSGSFNAMAARIQEREQMLRSQLQENDRLLLNILPARTAERLKQGERTISEHYPSVTVLYADLEGFQWLTSELDHSQAIEVLNEMIGAFDHAAESCGVEKLRSSGSTYLAVCGLSVPRVDDEKRTVELGLQMLQVVERLSAKHGVHLSLDIGIHSGELAAGVVGTSKFYYDVWGETIDTARAIHVSAKKNVIQATEPVVRALDGLYRFAPLPPIERKGQESIAVWEVQPLPAPALTAASSSES